MPLAQAIRPRLSAGIGKAREALKQTPLLERITAVAQRTLSAARETVADAHKALETHRVLQIIEDGVDFEPITVNRPQEHPQVVLITDFGNGLPQSEVEAALRRFGVPGSAINNNIRDVDAFNIVDAAFHVSQTLQTLAPGDVIELVVDPGVGNATEDAEVNDRRIIARTKGGQFLIGPNNGCFDLAEIEAAWEIDFEALDRLGVYQGGKSSGHATFHGRDVFAPAAAIASHISRLPKELQDHVLNNTIATELPLEKLHRLNLEPGQLLHTDRYGNLKFNLTLEDAQLEIGSRVNIELIRNETGALLLEILDEANSNSHEAHVVSSFADSEDGQFVIYQGSSKKPGTNQPALELAINQASAANSDAVKNAHPRAVA